MENELAREQNRLSQIKVRLPSPQAEIERLRTQHQNTIARLQRAQQQGLSMLEHKFSSLGEQLNLVSPLATLERGFAIARDQDANILRRSSQVELQQDIRIQLGQGELQCTVEKVN